MKTGIKKTIIITACLIMILGVIGIGALSASADNPTSGTCGENLTWTFENGTLTISGEGKMIDFYYTDDQPWFQWITEPIYDVVIEDGVTSIGSNAFICCNIKSIYIPDSVTSIGRAAFSGCTGLTSITIPGSVTYIGDSVFSGCTGLISIIVDSANTVYRSEGNCIIKTGSKTLIYGCKNSIIPDDDSVTSIGNGAFSDCTGLTSITIPDSVTSIGYRAFSGCAGLTSITVDSANTVYHSERNCLIETVSKALVRGCKNSIIPDDGSVTKIIGYAFDDCTGLTNITIPDSVTSIEWGAFSGCTGLTSITIPDSVTIIDSWVFYQCDNLADVYFSGSEEEWNAIKIYDENDCLINAKIHFYKANIIKGNSADNKKTYDYRTTVTFTANVPEGGSVQWYVDGKPAGKDSTLTVKDKTGDYTVKAVVTDKNGNQTMDEEQITIKHGFFDIIIWFFVHLINPGKYDVKQ